MCRKPTQGTSSFLGNFSAQADDIMMAMKTIDNRFDESLFRSFVGKKLTKIKHDEFLLTNTVTGIVGFMIDNDSYAMINDYEAVDYLGWDSEACICRIVKMPWDEILSFLEGKEHIAREINETIEKIFIVNDHIRSFSQDVQDYDLWETRAIVFDLGTHQISFTKQVCFFSMEIEINKGNDLIEKVETTDEFYDEHENSNEQTLMITREVVRLPN